MEKNQMVEWVIEPPVRTGARYKMLQIFCVLVGMACTGVSIGAAVDVWSDDVVLPCLIVIAVLAGFYLLLRQHSRRVSSIYAITLGVGLIATLMGALDASLWLTVPGGLMCGLIAWALARIENRGWLYAR